MTTFRRRIDFDYPFDLVVELDEYARVTGLEMDLGKHHACSKLVESARCLLPVLAASLKDLGEKGLLACDVDWTVSTATSFAVLATIHDAQRHVIDTSSLLAPFFKGRAA